MCSLALRAPLAALLILLAGTLAGCWQMEDPTEKGEASAATLWDERFVELPDPVALDLEEIRARDTLRVLMTYNSTSYFVYRGEPMGYEYDLLKRFAQDNDVVLQVRMLSSRDSMYHLLNLGVGDIAADRIVPTAADTNRVAFTQPLYETAPVLVQHEAADADSIYPESVDTTLENATFDAAESATVEDSLGLRARLIRRPPELAGEQVTLPEQSPYLETLVELEDAITGDIQVVELDTVLAYEAVIRQIARGEVRLTVAPNNLARLKETYYENIHVRPVLDEPYNVSWAVRSNAPLLQAALDAWILRHRDTAFFKRLYKKYFVDRRAYRERIDSKYLTSETGQLSDYDALFRAAAEEIGWDWRLLASQAYQESRFKPRARSWAGAMGLMQLMPTTARELGVRDPYDPEENVRGGAAYLDWLRDYWEDKIADESQRLRFILASYNVGAGHVLDARRLAEKYDGDPDVWGDVAYWLLQKSKRKYYKDPVVRHGYARGLEPVTYVAHVLDRYAHYKAFVEPGAAPPASDTTYATAAR